MLASVQVMNGHQYATSGTQRSNVQVQQVLIGERLKHGHVNFTVDEVFCKRNSFNDHRKMVTQGNPVTH